MNFSIFLSSEFSGGLGIHMNLYLINIFNMKKINYFFVFFISYINAVKGVNIGSGMNSAQLSGEQNSDEI